MFLLDCAIWVKFNLEKKPKAENKETKSKVKNKKPDISGYRLVDMEVLASVFELIPCN